MCQYLHSHWHIRIQMLRLPFNAVFYLRLCFDILLKEEFMNFGLDSLFEILKLCNRKFYTQNFFCKETTYANLLKAKINTVFEKSIDMRVNICEKVRYLMKGTWEYM